MRAHLAHREMKDVHPDRSPALHQALLPKLLHEQRQAELLACPSLCAKAALPSLWQICACDSAFPLCFSPQAIYRRKAGTKACDTTLHVTHA